MDIVKILNDAGFKTIEGKEAVLKAIKDVNEVSQEFIAWWNIVTDSLSCNTDKDLMLIAWKAWQVKKCTCLTLGGVPPSWLCPIHGKTQRKRDEKYPYKSTLPPNGAGGSRAWE